MELRGTKTSPDRVLRRLLADSRDVDTLVERVADHRHRRIQLLAYDFPATVDVSGMWLALPDQDVIAYPSGASPMRRCAVIGHEIGHMLLDHDVASIGKTLDLADVPVTRFLAREHYDNTEEAAAERVATLVVRDLMGRKGTHWLSARLR